MKRGGRIADEIHGDGYYRGRAIFEEGKDRRLVGSENKPYVHLRSNVDPRLQICELEETMGGTQVV